MLFSCKMQGCPSGTSVLRKHIIDKWRALVEMKNPKELFSIVNEYSLGERKIHGH